MRDNLLSHPNKWEKFHAFFEVLTETVPKNQHRHPERSEESHIFLFKSKIRRGDPSAYSLRMTQKGKLTIILEHSQFSPDMQSGLMDISLSLFHYECKLRIQ
jgi:hypothetical protein